MREIKFRQPLWDKHNKFAGWHYWGFIDGIFIEPAGTPYSSLKEAEEQSQQYTGLKDKSGKESYKGSIVSYKALGSLFTGPIVWCKTNLTWVVEAVDGDGLRQRPFLAHLKDFEVHDNPELCEVKK